MHTNNLFYFLKNHHMTATSIIYSTEANTEAYRLDLGEAPLMVKSYRRHTHDITVYQLADFSSEEAILYQYKVGFFNQMGQIYQLTLNFDTNDVLKGNPILTIKDEAPPFALHPNTEIPQELLLVATYRATTIVRMLRKKLLEKIQSMEATYHKLEREACQLLMNFKEEYDTCLYYLILDDIDKSLVLLMPLVNLSDYLIINEMTQYIQTAIQRELLPTFIKHEASMSLTPIHLDLNQSIAALESQFAALNQDSNALFINGLVSLQGEIAQLFHHLKEKNDTVVPLLVFYHLRRLYYIAFSTRDFPKQLKIDPEITEKMSALRTVMLTYFSALNKFSPIPQTLLTLESARKNICDIDNLSYIDNFLDNVQLDLKNYRSMKHELNTYLSDFQRIYKKISTLLELHVRIQIYMRACACSSPVCDCSRHKSKYKPSFYAIWTLCDEINNIAEPYKELCGIDPCFNEIVAFTAIIKERWFNNQDFMIRNLRFFHAPPKKALVSKKIIYAQELPGIELHHML